MSDLRYAVYRLYDASDRLLYVGQSELPGERASDHVQRAPWGARVARIEREWFTNRPDALIHERALTLSLSPEFPTAVTGQTARTEAHAYVARDLRKAPRWYGDDVCPDPKAVARELLSASGYLDDSCVTPREAPTSDAEYGEQCRADRARIVADMAERVAS